jgi:hypothetical protein
LSKGKERCGRVPSVLLRLHRCVSSRRQRLSYEVWTSRASLGGIQQRQSHLGPGDLARLSSNKRTPGRGRLFEGPRPGVQAPAPSREEGSGDLSRSQLSQTFESLRGSMTDARGRQCGERWVSQEERERRAPRGRGRRPSRHCPRKGARSRGPVDLRGPTDRSIRPACARDPRCQGGTIGCAGPSRWKRIRRPSGVDRAESLRLGPSKPVAGVAPSRDGRGTTGHAGQDERGTSASSLWQAVLPGVFFAAAFSAVPLASGGTTRPGRAAVRASAASSDPGPGRTRPGLGPRRTGPRLTRRDKPCDVPPLLGSIDDPAQRQGRGDTARTRSCDCSTALSPGNLRALVFKTLWGAGLTWTGRC